MAETVKKPDLRQKKPFVKTPLFLTLVSIGLGLIVGGVVLLVAGFNPFEAYWVILRGVFERPKYMAYTVIYATPLIITGLSVAFAFRTGLFNIGVEGQFIMGTVTAVLVGAFLPLPPVIHPIFAILAAILVAALWGALAGFLKSKYGVNEVISTIMLNWIAFYVNNLIVSTPGIKSPIAPKTPNIKYSASIELFSEWKDSKAGIEWINSAGGFGDFLRANVNLGILLAILAAVIVWFILNRTTLGYELRSVGFNHHAAEYGGINVKRSMVVSMAIAGGLAGLAGAQHVLGFSKEVAELAAIEGFGMDGIAVALIGANSPGGCVAAGFLFGILKYGGSKIQNELGAPMEIINIMMGVIIFFVAMPKVIELYIAYRAEKAKARKE